MRLFQAGILAWLLIPSVLSDTYETIASLDAYKSQRQCGQACFWVVGAGAEPFDVLGLTLGCTQPVRDSCFCRTDVQTDAETYLSTCISSGCTGIGAVTNDISMAVSIYDSYCEAKGLTADRNPATAAATTTAAPTIEQNPTATQAVTKTVYTSVPTSNDGASSVSSSSRDVLGSETPITSITFQTSQSPSPTSTPASDTPTPSPPSNSGSRGGLGEDDIITIVFGVLGAVVAIGVGIWQGRSNSALRTLIRGRSPRAR